MVFFRTAKVFKW